MKKIVLVCALALIATASIAQAAPSLLSLSALNQTIRGEQAFTDLQAEFPAGTFDGLGGFPSDRGDEQLEACKVTTSYAADGSAMTYTMAIGENAESCTMNKADPKFREDILDPDQSRMFGTSDNTEEHPDLHGCRIAKWQGNYMMINFDGTFMAVCIPNKK